jgi:rubrerythrin
LLKIGRAFVEKVRAAKGPQDLHDLVQQAIELEHATIPAYLCAYFTLKLGSNQVVAEILRSIAIEEMLHMSIASNLLVAIGGSPVIDKPGFIPTYPGLLPMNIGNGLMVPLEKCTVDLVRNVFMVIEAPEDPIVLRAAAAAGVDHHTIGEFYAALDAKLRTLGQGAFIGDFNREMVDTSWFPPDELFVIDGPDSASAAIEVIVNQGEGTPKSPLGPHDEPAHYYRFEQIVRGKRLVHDAAAPLGFSFAGAAVTLDNDSVWNMQPNPDPDALPAGSPARLMSTQFANAYTRLLGVLHQTFNGDPSAINRAMGLMYELRLLAQQVLPIPVPGSPELCTGLPFRYQPSV